MQHHINGVTALEKKVWTGNAKDVEWLTVQLADNSEEITSIKHKLDKLTQKNKQENLNNKKSRHSKIS